jgi:hypothetical protein
MEPGGQSGAGGKRGVKKPGTPKVAMIAAEVSLNSERARSPGTTGFQDTGWDTMSQNSFSRSTRFSGSLPAMIAELIAPIEMPATHSGSKPLKQSAW